MKITIELNGIHELLDLKTWIASLAFPPVHVDVTSLGLDPRTVRCLHAENIMTTDELIRLSPMDLLRIPNLGKKSTDSIIVALAARGMELS